MPHEFMLVCFCVGFAIIVFLFIGLGVQEGEIDRLKDGNFTRDEYKYIIKKLNKCDAEELKEAWENKE